MLKKFIVVSVLLLLSTSSYALTLSGLTKAAYQPSDSHTAQVYQAAAKNLDGQFVSTSDGTIYVSTGDIPAEWLRDSSVETRPFLLFASHNADAATLVRGVIRRQIRNLLVNPYANAFRQNYTVWENKFEIDSLSYPLLLAWTYWKTTGDASIFDPEMQKGLATILMTLETEQDHAGKSKYKRPDLSGHPVAKTGMIWSGFRPSDDACTYNFLIPAQFMAVQALTALTEISKTIYADSATATRAANLAASVMAGVQRYGTVTVAGHGKIYAYEVDGLGHANIMDDGNLPSLLSLPMTGGVSPRDPLYLSTRAFSLSAANPFYISGKAASGVGSPHTPKGMIWPLALLAQAFTATGAAEKQSALQMILASDPGDHLLHESFDPNNVTHFTRPNFGWPNALFVEYVLTQMGGRPSLPAPKSQRFF